jgi:hypothetical protein
LIREETIEFQYLPILIEKINEILPGKLLCNYIQRNLLLSLVLSTIYALLTCFAGTALAQRYILVAGGRPKISSRSLFDVASLELWSLSSAGGDEIHMSQRSSSLGLPVFFSSWGLITEVFSSKCIAVRICTN